MAKVPGSRLASETFGGMAVRGDVVVDAITYGHSRGRNIVDLL